MGLGVSAEGSKQCQHSRHPERHVNTDTTSALACISCRKPLRRPKSKPLQVVKQQFDTLAFQGLVLQGVITFDEELVSRYAQPSL